LSLLSPFSKVPYVKGNIRNTFKKADKKDKKDKRDKTLSN